MTPSPLRSIMPWAIAALAVVLLAVGLVVFWPKKTDPPPIKPSGPPLFEDVTESSGVSFTYRSGMDADMYTILESLGGGVGMLDYDRDGLLDLYFPGGGGFETGTSPRVVGRPGRLFKNLGGWKFRDVTEEVGLGASTVYTHGVAVADYDGDGWPDLLVTGYGRMTLYRNVAGPNKGRRFVDVTATVGLDDSRWTTSAAFADLTGKGRPDLYVCRYVDWSFANDPRCTNKADPSRREVCEPQRFKALPHSLYRNEGGKFVEVSDAMKLRKDGKGLGVIVADFDDDGRPDIYVANDASDNFLYRHLGDRFAEIGGTAGVATDDSGHYNGSMGVDVGDYDGSRLPSIWVTNYQGEYHALYLNTGNGNFSYQTRLAGVAALGQQYVGFGTSFLDADNDGWLDLVFVNGHVLREPFGAPFRQKPILLHNVERNRRRFFYVSNRGGSYFDQPALGRGLAVGDLDNDGWPDLVISHSDSPVTLLRNIAGRSSQANWLGIELVGKGGRPVAGAWVTAEVGEKQLVRFARGGGSYLSSSDPRLLFGLGDQQKVDRVTVRWPWGQKQEFTGLQPGRYWVLEEGKEKPREARYGEQK